MKNEVNIFAIILIVFLTIAVLGVGVFIGLNIKDYNKSDNNVNETNKNEQVDNSVNETNKNEQVDNSVNDTNNNEQTDNTSNKAEKNDEEYEITYKEEVEEYKNNKEVVIFRNKRTYPVSNSTKLTNILSEVKELSNKNWKEANSTAKSMIDDGYGENVLDVNEILGVDIKLKLEFVNDKIITFTQVQEGSFGGVSWPDIKGYNFSLETKKLLTIKDIATNSDKLIDKVHLYSKNYIENKYGEGLHDMWKQELKDNLFKDNNWVLSETNLYIALEKYSIADGANGIIDIEIPYSEINDHLKEEYKF